MRRKSCCRKATVWASVHFFVSGATASQRCFKGGVLDHTGMGTHFCIRFSIVSLDIFRIKLMRCFVSRILLLNYSEHFVIF